MKKYDISAGLAKMETHNSVIPIWKIVKNQYLQVGSEPPVDVLVTEHVMLKTNEIFDDQTTIEIRKIFEK